LNARQAVNVNVNVECIKRLSVDATFQLRPKPTDHWLPFLLGIFHLVYRHLQCASDMKNSEQLSYTYAKYLVQLQCVIGSLRLTSIIAMENIN